MARKIGTLGRDILIGTEQDDLQIGYAGNDTLDGKGGNDVLKGGKGNDKLYGGKGADTLLGGAGNDRLDPGADLDADIINGGAGIDTVDYSRATSGVLAYLDANTSLYGAAGDTYIAVENMIGGAFADYLQNAGGGTAFGGAGNDTLYGGGSYGSTEDGGIVRGDAGIDILDMSYGNTSAWVQNGQGVDTIRSFAEGSDKIFIKLSEFGLGDTLDFGEVVNSNNVIAFGNYAQLIFEGDAQRLWLDSNGANAGGLTLLANLTNATYDDGVFTPNINIDDFEWII